MTKSDNTKPGAHLGDFVVAVGMGARTGRLEAVLSPDIWPRVETRTQPAPTYEQPSARIELVRWGDVVVTRQEGALAVGLYHLTAGEAGETPDRERLQTHLLGLHRRGIQPVNSGLRGKYCYLLWDEASGGLAVATDAFHTYPVFYAEIKDGLVCGTDLRLVLAASGQTPGLARHALYHYLNFAYIPAPLSAFAGIRKLTPGSLLQYRNGRPVVTRYWAPAYPEDLPGSERELTAQLRGRIIETVERHRPQTTTGWGAFLSGGTDSSSITGILARQNPAAKVSTFSIGFGETDYDELHFARIAARAFATDSHVRHVTAEDTLALIPWLARTYDEPYGNSSAVPTAYCAKMAREHGVQVLIAGDGGDEIFGGNERYAKDKILGWYYRLPAPVKRLGRLIARAAGPLDARSVNRIKNIIRRGSLPNPDRFYTDDSFASDHYGDLLTYDFRHHVDVGESLEFMRTLYREAGAGSELHRLMYIDLRMAIAENDLVKVNRTSKAFGVSVLYPYLDRGLVDFTGRLGAVWKVKGLTKRYLFKKAMTGILPQEILTKKKHGFGLPVGVWFREHAGFKQLLNDVLLSRRALERGYFERRMIERLVQRHQQNVWDYTQELWLLLMLELWHREHVDA
jgi:asparagine synthase (glutamine-hydrolysing)